ncbi:MAG: PKD domain-containing protein, partial [Methanoregulaceae archaeon]|nr:PKD domain-containing protein [Methanoregulaceae archaeon]
RIITARKEDIPYSKHLNFYLQNLQWLDIFPPPYEAHFKKLLDQAQYLLPPKAAFSANGTEGKVPLKVLFSDESSGSPVKFEWDFGDGGTSKEKNPGHLYKKAGIYTVSLTVTNGGGSDTVTNTDFITVNSPVLLKSAFSAKITRGKVPLKVQFTDESTGSPTGYEWNFGDGGTSTEKSPGHVYEKAGVYDVSLTVKNSDGTDIERKSGLITVDSLAPPKAAFSAKGTKGKVPLKVQFTDESTGSPTRFEWNFGDGTTSTEKSPGHVYEKPGVYDVTLTVKNDDGFDTAKKTEYVTIDSLAPPKAAFSVKGTKGKVPLKVRYEWNFGDGTTSTEKSPGHVYEKAGVYDVSLTVKNSDGTDIERKSGLITVDTPLLPKAAFSATVTKGKVPLKVQFTDESSGSPTGYGWDFGDGEISNERNPVHQFSKPGSYDIRLIVMNDSGTDTAIKSGYIRVDAPILPKAAFTAITTEGKSPFRVQFNDASAGSPAEYTWDFGDGATSKEKNPGHVYTKAGIYDVTLIVKNEDGEDRVRKQGIIRVSSPEGKTTSVEMAARPVPALYYIVGIIAVALIIGAAYTGMTLMGGSGGHGGSLEAPDFTFSPESGTAPLSVQFTASSPETPDSWFWNFGDDSTSDLPNPLHLYNDSGNYTATLQVGNDGENSPLVSKTVQVLSRSPSSLVAKFTADPMKGKPPLTVQFRDESVGETESRSWNFGDGYTSTERNPLHTYQTPGNYSVVLAIQSACCEDTTTLPIMVEPEVGPSEGPPVADFTVKKGIVTSYSVFFDGTISQGSDLSYIWGFEDNTMSTSPTPVKFYQGPGTHQVTLKVANARGQDSITKRIIVSAGGDVAFED